MHGTECSRLKVTLPATHCATQDSQCCCESREICILSGIWFVLVTGYSKGWTDEAAMEQACNDVYVCICTSCIYYKYFDLKNSWGCHSNSNYLLFSFASQDTTTCPTMQPHTERSTHTVSLRHGHTNTQTVHTFSCHIWVVPKNLASHARYID